jgi:molybdenum cofactor cytidylyltransferase
VAVVLAAGSSTRFGAPKPLALLDGRPLLIHVLDAARESGVGRSVVVVGHDADAVAAAVADRSDVEVVVNPDHRSGQASSVGIGLAAAMAPPHAEVAVMLLADQPGIDPAVIRRVVDALEDGSDAARARYEDGAGHPVAFPRRVWTQLREELTGDAGARQLFDDLQVTYVPVSAPSPPDVDRPEDLDRLMRSPQGGEPRETRE